MNYGLFLIVGIVGFLLTILWFGTFYRNSKWYNFRMNQAKKAEACLIGDTDKWYLLNKDANSFSDGEKVTIIIEEPENKKNKKECQIDVIGIKNEIAGYIMIIIFALIYLNIIIWSLIKISC